MTDYSKLKLALDHLDLQVQNYLASAGRAELTPLDREGIAESVIQRFEVAYDTAWKTLKRHLTEELGLVEVQNSPKPILRLADQNNLLDGKISEWLTYADTRTSTAHDYSGDKAAAALLVIPAFVVDARGLYGRLAS